ncbi:MULTISPECIES: GGDEF domain-containing protein [Phyllobacteriaceae]|jgi:diguanylate cyclase (GGDEF)-like protein|uniref:GGDEF domain-containing protein n=1 Tax=Phyllobacteriaceae TaxID=69277 RepID=UPI0004651E13|nr:MULTISPECIES: GGDEF domain-containing protein [Mesorhizobium]MBN9234687.1 GGDEF domain-containing protein [Mesorhizobium sp.]MDQ0328833.1 diguanylate cyclase (GGDEF)-like protein [Mesorhizobium sp. YL-MeA3-2017]
MMQTNSQSPEAASANAAATPFGSRRRRAETRWSLDALRLRLRRLNRDQSLYPKLSFSIGLAVLCATVLATMILSRAWNDFAEARQNLYDIQYYRQILDAANFLSAERGPANNVMSESPSPSDASLKRLADFRARSDAALAGLAAAPEVPFLLHDHPVPSALLAAVTAALAEARDKVDQVQASKGDEAKLRAMQQAIEAMFDVSDRFRSVVTWRSNELISHDSGLAAPALIGQMLADLREYGGRAASEVIAPLASHQRIPLPNIIDARQSQGRIYEIWQMLHSQTALNAVPDLAKNQAAIDALFFGVGMDLIDKVIKEGKDSTNYSITATDLTTRFVPTMKPIEDYRMAFLDEMVSRFSMERDGALRLFLAVALATAVILAVLIGVLLAVRRDVFRPLLQAHEEVIGLAEDRPPAARADLGGAGEIVRLFNAIDVLQDRMRERASLTSELRVQAETDGLTGVLNRRTLDHIAQNGGGRLPADETLCLVMVDIDHFKNINDSHGHLAGDRVLVDTATLLKRETPAGGVVARFGGEEFALLFACPDIDHAAHLAEGIRMTLQGHRFTIPGGAQLAITASFGVACGQRSPRDWRHLVERADRALYQAKSDGRNRVSVAPDVVRRQASAEGGRRMPIRGSR